MSFKKEREHLCEIGRRIWHHGLSPGTAGNISIRVAPAKIIISPTLTSLGFLNPQKLSILDLNGEVEKESPKPSSEYKLHLYVYNNRPEINAVIHAHPPFASAFAVAGLEPSTFIQPETIVFLGKVPLIKYGTPSTNELTKNLDSIINSNLCNFILQNHGVLCFGEELDRAYFNLETLENLSKVTVLSKILGGEKEISKKNISKIVKLFKVKIEL